MLWLLASLLVGRLCECTLLYLMVGIGLTFGSRITGAAISQVQV